MTSARTGLVVIGGGAAGLVAAIRAAELLGAGAVTVLEAWREAGRKVLISGGGRCNVLPMEAAPERFVSSSPQRTLRRFLDRFPLGAQRAFFEELLGAPLREESETRKLFPPTNRSRDVRDALLRRARDAGVSVRCGEPVARLGTLAEGGFAVRHASGETVAGAVVLTTGGLSVLAGAADGKGLDWAAALGHAVRPTYPALAPLVAARAPHAGLAGLSSRASVEARAAGAGAEHASSRGGFLFTHRGYSGPAALDVSHVVELAARRGARASVTARFEPAEPVADWDGALRTGSGTLRGFLERRYPDRLAALILGASGVEDGPLARLPREARRALVRTLQAFPLPADATEGYRTAEVTGGGVALEEVDPGSGASRLRRGLFLAGELLDAFGPIGGFNFQWAWATGRTAGEGAARFLSGR